MVHTGARAVPFRRKPERGTDRLTFQASLTCLSRCEPAPRKRGILHRRLEEPPAWYRGGMLTHRTALLAITGAALLSSATSFAQTTQAPRPAPAPQTAPAPQAAPASSASPPGTPLPSTEAPPQQQPSAPPPYGYPAYPASQQGYAPPYYAYPSRLDYTEGQEIPPGYHKDTHVRRGMIIGGAVTFGVLYTLSLIVADAARVDSSSGERNNLSTLYVPCIGPLILATKVDNGSGILVVDGLAQTAGVIMFIAGFAFPRSELVRNDLGSIKVLPMIGKERTGVSLVASF